LLEFRSNDKVSSQHHSSEDAQFTLLTFVVLTFVVLLAAFFPVLAAFPLPLSRVTSNVAESTPLDSKQTERAKKYWNLWRSNVAKKKLREKAEEEKLQEQEKRRQEEQQKLEQQKLEE
jgi:hypothetical protein